MPTARPRPVPGSRGHGALDLARPGMAVNSGDRGRLSRQRLAAPRPTASKAAPSSELPVPNIPAPHPEHCRAAFVATGPATADGQIVFGHITMFNLVHEVRHFIMSGSTSSFQPRPPRPGCRPTPAAESRAAWTTTAMNDDAGLLVAETTIAQTKFQARRPGRLVFGDPQGAPVRRQHSTRP